MPTEAQVEATPPSSAAPGPVSWRPVLFAWVLLSALTGAPYLRAWLAPPAGKTFQGVFYFDDDQYNYLSYVEQAERGAFLFANKLVLEPHPRLIVNLEWWVVGRLSALLGGRPFLAYRLFWLAAAFALVLGVDRWLRAAGLPESHRLPALLLVGLGGGLGGLAWRAGLLPVMDAIDIRTGLFPFLEVLANPHFVAGTALLVWSLWALHRAATPRDHAGATLLGTALGLVRPYDLFLLGGTRGLAVLLGEAPRNWLRRLAPLLGLVPAMGYLSWVFYAVPWFGSFGVTYAVPPLSSFLVALAPASMLAALPGKPTDPRTRTARLHLASWIAVVLFVLLLRPVGFRLQFVAGLGVPLLALGAVGLARFPPPATLLPALLLSTSSLVALQLVFADDADWYVTPERLEVAAALRISCHQGDLALTPPDSGLYVLGLKACRPYVSHAVAPFHAERDQAARRFFEASPPAERAAFLEHLCITHLALPGDAGDAPEAWLGAGTPFRRIAVVGGEPRRISLYARADRSACAKGSSTPRPVSSP
jgi:hypothetical protein